MSRMRVSKMLAGTARPGLLAAALGLAAILPAAAQAPASNGPIWDGRQHQPTASGTGDRAGTGGAPSTAREDAQLRDLNALSRQLSPGTPVPAPGAEQGSSGRR